MNRAGRLQSARSWLEKFKGKNVVRAYRRRFGVDFVCALQELRMLGVGLDPVYVERLEETLRNRKRRRPKPMSEPESQWWPSALGDEEPPDLPCDQGKPHDLPRDRSTIPY